MEKELQQIIDDFITEIENKEDVLLAFKTMVDEILLSAKEKMNEKLNSLDSDLQSAIITEEQYKQRFDEFKQDFLVEVKKDLDTLINNLKS